MMETSAPIFFYLAVVFKNRMSHNYNYQAYRLKTSRVLAPYLLSIHASRGYIKCLFKYKIPTIVF